MILIIGLGNPGKEYELTRHNIGFIILEEFVENLENPTTQYYKYDSLITEASYSGKKILLLKPLTFMNTSGSAIFQVYRDFQSEVESILVIHDELDIEFGQIRLKSGGSSGGHNGLESIIKKMGNSDFNRLRFGIGRPTGKKDAADFVLTKFKKREAAQLPGMVEKAIEAIKDYILNGVGYSMNKYNSMA